MRHTYDFRDGIVSCKIIDAISSCKEETVRELWDQGKLRTVITPYQLTAKCLLPNYVCDYAAAAGIPTRDFFFDKDYQPSYTPYDKAVIKLLDSLTQKELEPLYDLLSNFFPNKFATEYIALRPSRKLNALLARMSAIAPLYSAAHGFRSPAYRYYTGDGYIIALERLRKNHYAPQLVLHSDELVDLATYTGVSLHWILNLQGPLFCRCNDGDKIFDLYTLAQPKEKKEILELLAFVADQKAQCWHILNEKLEGDHVF